MALYEIIRGRTFLLCLGREGEEPLFKEFCTIPEHPSWMFESLPMPEIGVEKHLLCLKKLTILLSLFKANPDLTVDNFYLQLFKDYQPQCRVPLRPVLGEAFFRIYAKKLESFKSRTQ